MLFLITIHVHFVRNPTHVKHDLMLRGERGYAGGFSQPNVCRLRIVFGQWFSTYWPAFFLMVFSIETSPSCLSYKVYSIITSAELRRRLSYFLSRINSIGILEEFRDFISSSDESRDAVLKSNKFFCRSDSYWEGPRIDSPPRGQLS